MPHEVQQPPKPNKPPPQKGKPLGIPKWGWAAAIAIGLFIGFVLYKKSSSSSSVASDTSPGPNSSPLGSQGSGTGGGVVASPPPTNTAGSNPPTTVTTEQQTSTPTATPDIGANQNYTTTPDSTPVAMAGGYTVPAPVPGAPQSSQVIPYSTGHGPQLTG